MSKQYCSVLTIAGSDSGGCAGIQADIKSISACGAYAASVITATTAQNTLGVHDIHPIPVAHIEKQLDAVLSDIKFNAIKIGMLHSCEIIELVKTKLMEYEARNIVVDPVMIATSGDRLINENAIECLKSLLSIATVITPNADEAALLLGREITAKNATEAASELGKMFNTSVLLKGGHIIADQNELTDVLFLHSTEKLLLFANERIDTNNTHGTGCSLSSSIAAFMATGHPVYQAVERACDYIHTAIFNGQNRQLGKGNGPINHFGL